MQSSCTFAFFVACCLATGYAFLVPDSLKVDSPGDICHGLDCPKFTVLNKTNDWELRRVEASKWVATNGTAMTKDEINSDMFHKLFEYISGKNEKGVKIDMTAPVLTTVIHGAGPNCESDFVMHFMLPHQYWASPIKPTDPSVFIVEAPAMDVFVRSFGGFAKDDDYIKALTELSDSLAKSSYKVDEKFFFEAGYDGPYTFRNRHNEVWLHKM